MKYWIYTTNYARQCMSAVKKHPIVVAAISIISICVNTILMFHAGYALSNAVFAMIQDHSWKK